jgi:hypothetical protein
MSAAIRRCAAPEEIRNCTEAIATMGLSTFLRTQLQELESPGAGNSPKRLQQSSHAP